MMSPSLGRQIVLKISPDPSLLNPAKSGTFCKGRAGGILVSVSTWLIRVRRRNDDV